MASTPDIKDEGLLLRLEGPSNSELNINIASTVYYYCMGLSLLSPDINMLEPKVASFGFGDTIHSFVAQQYPTMLC